MANSNSHFSPAHDNTKQTMQLILQEGWLTADPDLAEHLSEQLIVQGYRVSIMDRSSLLFQGSAQQLEELLKQPQIIDSVPLASSPFAHGSDNTAFGSIAPPPNHLECDVYPNPPDPRTHVDHPGEQVSVSYHSAILEEEYPGLIYLPSQHGRVLPGKFPLAILIHGRHYDHDWYQQIQQHLARNGIASVSIQYSADHEDQDYDEGQFLNRFQDHMDVLLGNQSSDFNPAHNLFNGTIALVGHSMGGGYAIRAAQWLKEQASAAYDVQLMSVLNLAPNPQYDDWILTPGEARGLLVIYGADDADKGVNKLSSSGFLTYDRSGHLSNEYTFNGYWRNRFTKSMVYLQDANHNSFIDDDVATNQGPDHDLSLGYITAYLRWSLKNDQAQQVLFKQQHHFSGNASAISLQYSDGRYRRVLDHFEGPYTSWNTLGGRNRFYHINRQKGSAGMNDNPQRSGHDTRVLQLAWDATQGGVPLAQFKLPMPFTLGTDYRDLSRLRYLSFRMGQLSGGTDADEDLEFIIRLTSNLNGVVKSRQILLSDVGHIPSPYADGQNSQVKTAMNTVMIPLCVFAGIDFTRVSHLSFQFNHPDRPRGAVQMDSLEFLY